MKRVPIEQRAEAAVIAWMKRALAGAELAGRNTASKDGDAKTSD